MHQVFNNGFFIKWADYGFAGHERCSGGLGGWLSGRGEMVLPRVVLCTRLLTMEFLSAVDCVCCTSQLARAAFWA